jgi:16S rRNA (guanine527-N7)-methyltransferase
VILSIPPVFINFAIVELIRRFFPDLQPEQDEKLSKLFELYSYWNERINLISRKDIEHLEERHILHSLAIAKIIMFEAQTKILDVGTGGGFPGIPLAILFPEASFLLVDSVGKKIKVVNEIKETLGLKNVEARQIRAEEVDGKFDFIISRAVTRLPEFIKWVKDKIRHENFNSLDNGVLYLKGGDIEEELNASNHAYAVYDLDLNFPLDFFHTKKLVYLPLS